MPLPESRRVADAGALRAMAHPLRQRLYELLVLRGPSTASDLADQVVESPSNLSWHLRKLAEHGFVEEAPGGTGRQRPWQATSMGLEWGHTDDPDAARAGAALTRSFLDHERRLLDQSLEHIRQDPEWEEASSVTQSRLWLTREELEQLNAELKAVHERYVERIEDPARRPAGSRLCAYVAWAVVTYDLMDPTPEQEA